MPTWPEAAELVEVGPDLFNRPAQLTPSAAAAWVGLRNAAQADGIELQLVSAFRSITRQEQLVRRQLAAGKSLENILTSSAYPGHSEHQTGRAIDLSSAEAAPLEVAFAETAAFRWLFLNAHQHGFRLSYPADNHHGIVYEPWHWCWHGPAESPERRR